MCRIAIISFLLLIVGLTAAHTASFVSPTPTAGVDNTTYGMVFNFSTDDEMDDNNLIEVDGVNYSCTRSVDKKSCNLTLSYAQHLTGNTYDLIGWANFSAVYTNSSPHQFAYYGCGNLIANTALIGSITGIASQPCITSNQYSLEGAGYTINGGLKLGSGTSTFSIINNIVLNCSSSLTVDCIRPASCNPISAFIINNSNISTYVVSDDCSGSSGDFGGASPYAMINNSRITLFSAVSFLKFTNPSGYFSVVEFYDNDINLSVANSNLAEYSGGVSGWFVRNNIYGSGNVVKPANTVRSNTLIGNTINITGTILSSSNIISGDNIFNNTIYNGTLVQKNSFSTSYGKMENNSFQGGSITISSAGGLYAKNNIFNSTFSINSNSYPLNGTKTVRTNIINGLNWGGNNWKNYSLPDVDGDGIGDYAFYPMGTYATSIDYLPLTNDNFTYTPPTFTWLNLSANGSMISLPKNFTFESSMPMQDCRIEFNGMTNNSGTLSSNKYNCTAQLNASQVSLGSYFNLTGAHAIVNYTSFSSPTLYRYLYQTGTINVSLVSINGLGNGSTINTTTGIYSVIFNFTSTSNTTANCTLTINGTQYAQNSSALNGTDTTLTTSPALIVDGTYSFNVSCNDSVVVNSQAWTETIDYIYDTCSLSATLLSPPHNSTFYDLSPINLTANVSLTNCSAANALFFLNSSEVSNQSYAAQSVLNYSLTASVGNFTWEVVAYGMGNLSNNATSASWLYQIVPHTLVVDLLSVNGLTGNGTTYPKHMRLNATLNFSSSFNSTANCSLVIDGTPVSSNASTENTTATFLDYSPVLDGNYSVWATCNDGYQEINSSTWAIEFILNATTPYPPDMNLTSSRSPAIAWTNLTCHAVVVDDDANPMNVSIYYYQDGVNIPSWDATYINQPNQTEVNDTVLWSEGITPYHNYSCSANASTIYHNGNSNTSADLYVDYNATMAMAWLSPTATDTFTANFSILYEINESNGNPFNCSLYLNATYNGSGTGYAGNNTLSMPFTGCTIATYELNCTDGITNISSGITGMLRHNCFFLYWGDAPADGSHLLNGTGYRWKMWSNFLIRGCNMDFNGTNISGAVSAPQACEVYHIYNMTENYTAISVCLWAEDNYSYSYTNHTIYNGECRTYYYYAEEIVYRLALGATTITTLSYIWYRRQRR